MDEKSFKELAATIREGGAILRGEQKAARRTIFHAAEVRAIRERTKLSQSEFAGLMGVSVKTLQNWEQERRHPTGPAAALLTIIAREPRLAIRAMHTR